MIRLRPLWKLDCDMLCTIYSNIDQDSLATVWAAFSMLSQYYNILLRGRTRTRTSTRGLKNEGSSNFRAQYYGAQ